MATVYSLVQWRKKPLPGQNLLAYLAIGVLDLVVVLGFILIFTSTSISWIHLTIATIAAVLLHYVYRNVTKEGLSVKYVLLTWLVAILVILTPVIG
ncbi:hypothetical protein BHU72_09845 [Desulfuribacillus stibiiarsenatis]|uniref:Uncharacterized protein n=1 Tax=Desulfuribacillus stibiiarsenatis TaxID=1390249 RepID=A0A1E5L3J2_9FIRM|nr:hypothetical protein [Desulfuribacillus stibiiarsenatis]OEH84499.1 hypothetical protein BHU72_09845 [Desulfuribacillus stibiiarsenatis]